jgi:hypothetical protein
MFAVGIWHGPKWTYAAFGALNGILIIVSALTQKRRNTFFRTRHRLSNVRAVLSPIVTFHLMVLSFVIFRADSLNLAVDYVVHLIPGFQQPGVSVLRMDWVQLGVPQATVVKTFLAVAVVEAFEWVKWQPAWAGRVLETPRWFRWSVYYAGIVMLFLWRSGTRAFIYAQF